ncbi:hypothetical protein [Sphingomonas sp. 8AM]|uniref:hypothetical protein n=1 Tax=Sphingomonas sp. 8AM TaxID=2653170 RepID=UPI0012F34D50|nr:hypothetical protein [Sphingomonas sp. 8AM]VXC97653.1 conserved hypothetical protein [Sphingomonas sp. 8AM]
MLAALLALVATTADSTLCVPVPTGVAARTSSKLEEHRALRKALDEPLPNAPTMVMLFGRGGHLATDEYSIVLAKTPDGVWHGTAVGRSKIWVEGGPYRVLPRKEWALDAAAGARLDAAITCRHRYTPATAQFPGPPPSRGYVPETVEIVVNGRTTAAFGSDDQGNGIAELLRPPAG